MKQKDSVKVVSFNGTNGEIEQHNLKLGDKMFEGVSSIIFDDYMKLDGLSENDKGHKDIRPVPPNMIRELTDRKSPNCVFPLKEYPYNYNLLMYCDDSGLLRDREWDYEVVTFGETLIGSLVVIKIQSNENVEVQYGDLELDESRFHTTPFPIKKEEVGVN